MVQTDPKSRFVWNKDDIKILKRTSKASKKQKQPDKFSAILDKELSGVK